MKIFKYAGAIIPLLLFANIDAVAEEFKAPPTDSPKESQDKPSPPSIPVGERCDDQDLCTQDDTIQQDGSCRGNTTAGVDDGSPCTTDSCDPKTGFIQHVSNCSKGQFCANKQCSPACHPDYTQSNVTGIGNLQCPSGTIYSCMYNKPKNPCPEGTDFQAINHVSYECSAKELNILENVQCLPGYNKTIKEPSPYGLFPIYQLLCQSADTSGEITRICSDLKPSSMIFSWNGSYYCCTHNPLPPACGNGQLDLGELCDGNLFAPQNACEVVGYKGGGLPTCYKNCQGTDYTSCKK